MQAVQHGEITFTGNSEDVGDALFNEGLNEGMTGETLAGGTRAKGHVARL
jgi:hypothetical protein